MSNAADPALMTIEEFLALPDDGVERDLIRGKLRESDVTRRNRRHSRCEARLSQYSRCLAHCSPPARAVRWSVVKRALF